MVATSLLSLFLRFYMARQNTLRDRLAIEGTGIQEKLQMHDEDEVCTREGTDVKDLAFRYSL
jgi:hypothetical protein